MSVLLKLVFKYLTSSSRHSSNVFVFCFCLCIVGFDFVMSLLLFS